MGNERALRIKLRSLFWKSLFWGAALWCVVAFFASFSFYLESLKTAVLPLDFLDFLIPNILYYLCCILVTPFIFVDMSRFSKQSPTATSLIFMWFRVNAFFLPMVMAYRLLIQVFVFNPNVDWYHAITGMQITEYFLQFMLFQVMVGFLFAINNMSRLNQAQFSREKLRAELAEVELDLTKSQFSPHFLFNSLNAISGLIRSERPKDALSGLRMIRDMLREATQSDSEVLIPFSEEWQFIESYLALQKLRFGNKLNITTDLDDGFMLVMWPRLTLQPLIENAIHHGADESGRVVIHMRACLLNNQARLEISNTYQQRRCKAIPGLGQGLALVRKRLDLLPEDQAILETDDNDEHYHVSISINA